MYTKFYDEFTRKTNGKFKLIKLSGAKYEKDTNLLTVNFIISAFEIQSFSDEQKSEVEEAVKKIFPGVEIAVTYTRTFADKFVVTNKILEFLNKNNQMLFRSINENTCLVRVENGEISVLFKLDSPLYKMLNSGTIIKDLTDFLDCHFTESVSIRSEEVQNDSDDSFDLLISNVASTDVSDLRLISVDTGEKLSSRGRVEGISQMPGYISDIKGEASSCVLCGKISNVSKRLYNNKKFKPDDPKSGPEKLPLIRFMIDDTTGKMECTCFPRVDDAEALETMLNTTPEVVCTGDVSRYNGNLSMTASAVFACKIDYSSINAAKGKPAPREYATVFPENYVSATQQSLLDDVEEVSSFFKGKTLVIFDLETTSKFPDSADIIQISALKVVDGVEKETFTSFVKPPKSIPQEIVELTSIDDDMVANAPKIAEVMPDFFKFVQGSVLVGHNIIGYDFPIVNRIAGDMGYKFSNDIVDTLTLSRTYLTEMSNHKLTTLSKNLKLEHENAHRADADVLATWGVLKEIAKRMDKKA